MTKTTTIDKERLAAFADGDLSPEDAAAVVIHLVDHPDDQAYVDEIMAANIALARAFNAPMDEGVPDRFANLILPDGPEDQAQSAANVIPLRGKVGIRYWAAGVFAAGVAIAAALATVAVFPTGDSGLSVGPVAEGSALHDVLTSIRSGVAVPVGGTGKVTVLSSLPTNDGFCREFEIISLEPAQVQLGLACQDGIRWTVDVLLAETYTSAPDTTGSFLPASGDPRGPMDRWLDRRGAGVALTAAEEERLLTRGWVQ